MRFDLTEEQALVQKTAREFAESEVMPVAAAIDREHRYPAELVRRMAELGLLGIAIEERFGGSGLDHVSYAVAVEEVSRACASSGVIMSINNSLVCDPLARFGTEDQKMRWLVPLAKGEKLGCFALSEPEAGSDAAAQSTTARKRGDVYVLNGVKSWITNGPVADVGILFAMTERDRGNKGITCFILPMKSKGVRTGPPDEKLGIRGSSSCQVFLDDVELDASLVLGQVGEGFKVALSALDGGRIGIAAQAVGIARAAFEDAVSYARQRSAFGKPIVEHQAIQNKLADMATQIDAARLLTLRAAWQKDRKLPFGKAAAMAKLFASEAANGAAREAIQIFGGNGYVTEYPVERHFRDAKITEIYEGTSEIQRMVIAGHLIRDNPLP
ncbi:MAG: acyl-CoA dehydrogenase [Steroidobacteraceae bacterium]